MVTKRLTTMGYRICMNCGRRLPDEQFELYPTGTRRRICRHCHYVVHTRKGRQKWVMRQRAKALFSPDTRLPSPPPVTG